MGKINHKVEVSYIEYKVAPKTNILYKSFEDMLQSEDVKQYKFHGDEKDYSIHIENVTDPDNIIGYVKTIQHSNIPPKVDDKGGMKPIIGEKENGGIGFSNIFLFDKSKSVLYYEVNSSGCTSNMFFEILSLVFKKEDGTHSFELSSSPVFNKDEYQRILQFPQYTKLRIEILAPQSVLQRFNDENNPVLYSLKDAVACGSEKLVIEQRLYPYSKNSLDNGRVQKIVSFVKNNLLPNKEVGHNVNSVSVTGKEQYKRKSETIELLGNMIDGIISLEKKKSHIDLQIIEKRAAIVQAKYILDQSISKLK